MKPMNRKELLSEELPQREMSVKEIEGANENCVPKLIIHSQFPNLTITPVTPKTEPSLKSPTEGSLKISIRYADITPPFRDKSSRPKSPQLVTPGPIKDKTSTPKSPTILSPTTLGPVKDKPSRSPPEVPESPPTSSSTSATLLNLPKGLSLLPVVTEQQRDSVIKESLEINPVSIIPVVSISDKPEEARESSVMDVKVIKTEPEDDTDDPPSVTETPPESSIPKELTVESVPIAVSLAIPLPDVPSSPEIPYQDEVTRNPSVSPVLEQDVPNQPPENCELIPIQETCADNPKSPKDSPRLADISEANSSTPQVSANSDPTIVSGKSTQEKSEIVPGDVHEVEESIPMKKAKEEEEKTTSKTVQIPPKQEASPVSVVKRKARLKISPRLSDVQRTQRLAQFVYGVEPKFNQEQLPGEGGSEQRALSKVDRSNLNGVDDDSSSESHSTDSFQTLPLRDCVVRITKLNPTLQKLFLTKVQRHKKEAKSSAESSTKALVPHRKEAKSGAESSTKEPVPHKKEGKSNAESSTKEDKSSVESTTREQVTHRKEVQSNTELSTKELVPHAKGGKSSAESSTKELILHKEKDKSSAESSTKELVPHKEEDKISAESSTEDEETKPPGGQSPKKSEGMNKGRSTWRKRKSSTEREAISHQGGKILRIRNGDEVMCTKVMKPSEKTRCTFCGKLTQSTNVWKHLLAVYKVNADIDEAIEYEWGAELFKCTDCGANLCSKAALGIHYHHLHSKTSQYECKCPCCSETFLTDVSLACHLATHCIDILKGCTLNVPPILDPPSVLHCCLCRKSYPTIEGLESHLKTHNGSLKNIQCKVCLKRFSKSYQLKCHMVVHTQLRPFKCEQCDKTFRFRSSLRTHNYSHIGVQPYKCKVCDKGFFESGNMVKHMRKTHKENTGLIPEDPKQQSEEKKVSTIKLVKVKTSKKVPSDDKPSDYAREGEPGSSTDSPKMNGAKSAFKIISLKKRKNSSILAKELGAREGRIKTSAGFKKMTEMTNSIKTAKTLSPFTDVENNPDNKQSKTVLDADSSERQSQKVTEKTFSQSNHKPQNTVDSTTTVTTTSPQSLPVKTIHIGQARVPSVESQVTTLPPPQQHRVSVQQQPLRIVPSVEQRLRVVPSVDQQHLRIVPSVEQQLRISSAENQFTIVPSIQHQRMLLNTEQHLRLVPSMEKQRQMMQLNTEQQLQQELGIVHEKQIGPPLQHHQRMILTVDQQQQRPRVIPTALQQPKVVSSTLWVPQTLPDLHQRSPALQQLEHMSRTMIRVPNHNPNVIYPNPGVSTMQQLPARNSEHSSLLFNLLTANNNLSESDNTNKAWTNGPSDDFASSIVSDWGDVPATVEVIPDDVIVIRKNCVLCETVCVTTIELTDHLLYYHRVSMRKVNELLAACCK